MQGGLGDDTYVVTNLSASIVEATGEGTDTVSTALASYSLTLAPNVENLTHTTNTAFSGKGNNLANVITGGGGADTLEDGVANTSGVDTLVGGGGNDTYVVDNAGVIITDSAGTDTVNSNVLSWTLATGLENLNFIGSGDFTGVGNTAANTIKGNSGNDTLTGAGGNDTLYGGLSMSGGNDVFVYTSQSDSPWASGNASGDTIMDLVLGSDKIDLAALSLANQNLRSGTLATIRR